MDINQLISDLDAVDMRNSDILHVTAYENQLSKTATRFLSSKLSERYYFGGGDEHSVIDWNPFTVLGLGAIENVLQAAEEGVKDMLGCSVVNLRPLSGVHAMLCVLLVATKPGDSVMIMRHEDGGHFSTQPLLEKTGRKIAYTTFDTTSLQVDVAATAEEFVRTGSSAIYLDLSYPTAPINLRELRAALGESATIIYDASHTVGLMMGGQFQDPFAEGADIICANTHKTLPGPHKGMIAFKDPVQGAEYNNIINNGLFSTSHTNNLISLAISILELQKYGKEYALQVVQNANALGRAFEELGYRVRKLPSTNDYTATHQVHVYLGDTHRENAYRNLVKNNISTNFDNRLGGEDFMRLGTQELTRRGMSSLDMQHIARLMNDAINGLDVQSEVKSFTTQFDCVYYSFDTGLPNVREAEI